MHSPKEHFHTYLQSLDADRAGLPDELPRQAGPRAAALRRHRLRAHAASSRRPSSASSSPSSAPPRRSRSPPRSFSAGSASPRPTAARRRGPGRCSTGSSSPPSCASPSSATSPAVSASAGSTSRSSTQNGQSVLAGVSDRLAALRRGRAAGTRPDHAHRGVDELASIPEQIVRFLAERLHASPGAACREHEPMLEVLIKRHYREHELHGPHTFVAGGRPFAVADYTLDDRPTHLTSTIGAVAELDSGQRPRHGRRQPTSGPGGGPPLRRRPLPPLAGGAASRPTRRATALAGLPAGACPSPTDVRRVAVATTPAGDRPISYFTFRPSEGAPRRGPPRARRAPDGRSPAQPLAPHGFDVTRLEAPEDVLLYECVARDNPEDRRLVALAQVRQLVVVRDEDGPGHGPAARRARHRQLPRGGPPGALQPRARAAPSST